MTNMEYKTLEEALGDFNPVEELVKLFYETDDKALKIEICRVLLKYVYLDLQEE